MAVQQELRQRLDEADGLRPSAGRGPLRGRLGSAALHVRGPDQPVRGRRPGSGLERQLRALTEAQERFERQSQADRAVLDERGRAQILALSTDFSRVWRDPKTPDRDRKRIVRLLVEDVALVKAERITAQVRFKGGSARTLILSIPPPAWAMRQTSPEVIAEIDGLLNHHTEAQIAGLLNEQGRRSGKGRPFTPRLVGQICCAQGLRSRFDRLRQAGLLTQQEIADRLGVCLTTVHDWRRSGLLRAYARNDKPEYLYEPVDATGPMKRQGIKLTDPRRFPKVFCDGTKGVQDEA